MAGCWKATAHRHWLTRASERRSIRIGHFPHALLGVRVRACRSSHHDSNESFVLLNVSRTRCICVGRNHVFEQLSLSVVGGWRKWKFMRAIKEWMGVRQHVLESINVISSLVSFIFFSSTKRTRWLLGAAYTTHELTSHTSELPVHHFAKVSDCNFPNAL